MAAKKQKTPKPKAKKPPTPKRAKAVPANETQAKLIEDGSACVSAQKSSPAGAQVASEAATVAAAIQTVSDKNKAYSDAQLVLVQAEGDVLKANLGLVVAINDYRRKGVTVAADDATVLASLGVQIIGARSPKRTGPADPPTDVRSAEGPLSGSSRARWNRPVGAASFVAQYKLEPAGPVPPGQAPPDWSPAEGYMTRDQEWLIQDLPPAAAFRLRVKSVGAQAGAWSGEVLCKAR